MKRRVLMGLIGLTILAASVFPAAAQKNGKLINVKIYLFDMFEQDDVIDAHDLFPVKRKVRADNPLRFTLEALMKGSTEDEESSLRLFSPAEEFRLVAVRQIKQTAYLNFTRTETADLDKQTAFVFKTAVRKTVLQFPSIKRVEICLDGILDFDRFGKNVTHKKCIQ